MRAPGFWCWGLFTTEILRDFSGEDDALKPQEGEGHPLSLMSLKRTSFGLLREPMFQVCVEHAMAAFYTYIAMFQLCIKLVLVPYAYLA